MHGRVRLPSLGCAHEPTVPVRARWTLARNTHLRRHQEGELHLSVHMHTDTKKNRQYLKIYFFLLFFLTVKHFSMPKNNKHSTVFPVGLQIGEYWYRCHIQQRAQPHFFAPFLLALCRVTGCSRLLHTRASSKPFSL